MVAIRLAAWFRAMQAGHLSADVRQALRLQACSYIAIHRS